MAPNGTQLTPGKKSYAMVPGAFPGAEAEADEFICSPPPSPKLSPVKVLPPTGFQIERKLISTSTEKKPEPKPIKKKEPEVDLWEIGGEKYEKAFGYDPHWDERKKGEKKFEIYGWLTRSEVFRGMERGKYPTTTVFNQHRSGKQVPIVLFVGEDFGFSMGISGVHCWKTFYTWTGVIFPKSGFLKDYFTKRPKKDLRPKQGSVQPEDCNIFLSWAHLGSPKESFFYRPIGLTSRSLDRAHATHWQKMVSCYALGKEWRAPEFCNAIMNILVENQQSFFEHCPLSQVMKNSDWWPTKDYTMVKSILKESMFAGQSEKPWMKDPCTYHEHAGAPKSYSCTYQWYGKQIESTTLH